MKSARYDDELLPKVMSFAVEDVFVSAILSVACTVLAEIGEDYKRPHADVRDLYAWAERFRAGVVETTDERTGAARDYDVRADRLIATETVAQFAPLLCGGLPHDKERALLRLLEGPRFCGHPDLKYALIPSTSPVSRDFRSREYWRGPVWPVMTWLFSWAFARRGWAERSLILRARRPAAGQRRHLRRVLRTVHRGAAGQHAAVVDRRRGAGLAGLTLFLVVS